MADRVIARDMSPFALIRRRIFALTQAFFPTTPHIRQVKVGDIQILVFANEYIGRRLILSKNFEAEELAALRGLLRPGDTVFDIGANIGFMAMNFARMVGSTGKVHAFEPIERNALLVRLSALVNGFDHVMVHQRAVSDTPGKTLARMNGDQDSAVAFFSAGGDGAVDSVETASVDSVAKAARLDRVDFIKIDVEGFEYDVLKGATDLLADPARRPRLLMIEIVEEYLHRAGATGEDIYRLLAEHGYDSFLLEGGQMRPIRADVAPPGNIFFLPREGRTSA